MPKKLWSGRFDRRMAPEVERFTASIGFDRRLYKYDIDGSIAHVRMLAKVGLVTKPESARIISGLKKVRAEIEKGAFRPGPGHEDIHMAVETRLRDIIGPVAAKLHTARSRNDQVALDTRLFLRDAIKEIISSSRVLQKSMVRLAAANAAVVMPGFTHLQHGQPVLVAHHLLAYVEMLERDVARLTDCLGRVNIFPLGSAAIAGTSLPIDRRYAAGLLGFDAVSDNSIDAVGDRDYVIEFLSAAAIMGIHLSRMAEEIVLWVSREFSFIDIDLSYCSGSSLMPQKANPDAAELVRGKSGRLMGDLVSVLAVMKGLPLAYNRDMQEDKEPLFDACDTVNSCARIMAGLWNNIRFRAAHLRASLEGDFSQATDLAEYLVSRGCPFREAHHTVGRLVADCVKKRKRIEDMTLPELRGFSTLFDSGALHILSAERCIERKRSHGSTSPAGVKKRIGLWKRKLGIRNA